MTFRSAIRLVFPAILAASLASAGCRSSRTKAQAAPDPAPSVAAPQLPSITIRDDSQGLTFSYITLDGGFQLVKKVADVPYEARDAVRVWSETSGDGIAGPWVYVADLRSKLPDGTYKVDVVTRDSFEKLAADRRAKGKAAPSKVEGEPAGAAKGKAADEQADAKVIIYGAEWCKPCHMAENYLKKRKIPFVHKDIEADEDAEKEMRRKLKDAGIKTHSIPVIDVGGKVLVGFSEDELDKAIAEMGG